MFDNLRDMLDFDDLLFEKRNKEYGAYQLRRKYNGVMVAGLLLGSILVSSAVIIPFLFRPSSDRILSGGGSYVQVSMEKFEPPVDQVIVPPAVRPPESKTVQEIVKYVPPVVVDSVPPSELTMLTTDQAANSVSENQIEVTGTGSGDDLMLGEGGGTELAPFLMVEVMPSFKGGDINKFRDWIQRRTNYPQVAIDNKIQGKVYVTFVIESDGSVSNITILRGVDPIIDVEVIKAIEASPKWSPGLQRGSPVRVRYSMQLNFTI
jgi:protein TonB